MMQPQKGREQEFVQDFLTNNTVSWLKLAWTRLQNSDDS